MSRTFVGVAITGRDIGIHDAADADKITAEILAPFHIDACRHEGRRGESCPCPPWRYDHGGGTVLSLTEGWYAADVADTGCLGGYVNSLGEWYSRWECTDFDQVVLSDFERIGETGPPWVLAVVQIHFF